MKKNSKKLLISVIIIFGIIGSLVQIHASTIPIAPAVFETSLQSPISTTSTTMTLANGTLANGTILTGYTCFTVDSGNPNVEFICGMSSGTTITGLVRGIDTLDGKTSDPTLIFSHRRGADVKITDFPVFSVVRNIVNGNDTLPNIISYGSAQTFTSGTQLIDKTYADNIAITGCSTADTGSYGCVQIPTQAQVDAGTQLGGTGAYLATNPALTRAKNYNGYAADSSGTDAYAITITPAITSYSAGQVFTFKAGTANTGAATLNVSGLGAKTIKKSVTTDLDTGDILANQIVLVEYDGTNMEILSNNPPKLPTTQTFTSSGTYTKPQGLKYAIIQVWAGGGSGEGSAGTNGGGGGGGGAYNTATVVGSLIGNETMVVGSGGAASTNALGHAGGNTNFGAFVTAFGGQGGGVTGSGGGGGGISSTPVSSQGGAPGGGAGATSSAIGQASSFGGGGPGGTSSSFTAAGESTYGGGGGGGESAGNGGNGGNSYYGGGGGAGGGAGPGAGGTSAFGGAGGVQATAGTLPAGGGGGSHSASTPSGAGAGGKIIVTEFY